MSSAAKVGEIFTKAGESYNKLGEMIMLLHPTGQELTALEKAVAKQVITLLHPIGQEISQKSLFTAGL